MKTLTIVKQRMKEKTGVDNYTGRDWTLCKSMPVRWHLRTLRKSDNTIELNFSSQFYFGERPELRGFLEFRFASAEHFLQTIFNVAPVDPSRLFVATHGKQCNTFESSCTGGCFKPLAGRQCD